MQGLVDANCNFIGVTVMHVGTTNDNIAFANSSLRTMCMSQPFPYHWVGDAAYELSKQMHIPYIGNNLSPGKGSYNFYQSQLRIAVERSFGILVARWGILWRAMSFDLQNSMRIVACLCTLNDYINKENGLAVLFDQRAPPLANGALAAEWHANHRQHASLISLNNDIRHGGCTLREELTKEIEEKYYYHARSHK